MPKLLNAEHFFSVRVFFCFLLLVLWLYGSLFGDPSDSVYVMMIALVSPGGVVLVVCVCVCVCVP